MAGFIKLHRKMLKWGWYSDPNTFRVFMHLLLTASYEENEFRGVKLKAGDVVFGRKKLAQELGLSERQVRTSLEHLISTNEITIKTTNRFSIATIENWAKYQCRDYETDQQTDQQKVQQPTNNRPTTDHTQEGKESKKVRNIFYPPTVEEVRAYCLERGNGIDPEVFWNFYESKNWMVGKNKMKKWKSAIITWEKNHPEQKAPPPPKKTQEEIDRELMILEEIRAQESEQRRMEREALHGKNS